MATQAEVDEVTQKEAAVLALLRPLRIKIEELNQQVAADQKLIAKVEKAQASGSEVNPTYLAQYETAKARLAGAQAELAAATAEAGPLSAEQGQLATQRNELSKELAASAKPATIEKPEVAPTPAIDPAATPPKPLDTAPIAINTPVDQDEDPLAPRTSGFGEANDLPESGTAPEDGVNPYGPGYGEGEEISAADIVSTPEDGVNPYGPGYGEDELSAEQQTNQATLRAEDAQEAAAQQSATLDKARAQNTIANQRSTKNNNDWRVKLRLAPKADYLYAASMPGILKPLKDTGGVIFPYTPSIVTSYKANYATADMTHSNYKGYFYQGSAVEPVTLSCPFTAQSTVEAEYLLAVVHFFKSVTKMFYGQDPQRGTPPPLVYLTGLGQFQFNEHPCVVQSFTYELPTDVDYIRAYSPNVNNSSMLAQRQASNSTTAGGSGGIMGGLVNRLLSSGLPQGGMTAKPPPQTLGTTTQPTYVPTKMNISITLLPVQSRQQVSKNFSLRQYANGDLLKGGFW